MEIIWCVKKKDEENWASRNIFSKTIKKKLTEFHL